jgi:hypothetical protein
MKLLKEKLKIVTANLYPIALLYKINEIAYHFQSCISKHKFVDRRGAHTSLYRMIYFIFCDDSTISVSRLNTQNLLVTKLIVKSRILNLLVAILWSCDILFSTILYRKSRQLQSTHSKFVFACVHF